MIYWVTNWWETQIYRHLRSWKEKLTHPNRIANNWRDKKMKTIHHQVTIECPLIMMMTCWTAHNMDMINGRVDEMISSPSQWLQFPPNSVAIQSRCPHTKWNRNVIELGLDSDMIGGLWLDYQLNYQLDYQLDYRLDYRLDFFIPKAVATKCLPDESIMGGPDWVGGCAVRIFRKQ